MLAKVHEDALKQRRELLASKEAAADMLREVTLLPFTRMNLWRCSFIQYFTFGKIREHYKKKKMALRARVDKILLFLAKK